MEKIDYEEISKSLYKNGYNIKEIADRLDIDPITIFNWVNIGGRRIITEEERQEMIQLRNKGYSYAEIANLFNVSISCVKKRLVSPAKLSYFTHNTISDEQMEKIKTMVNHHMPLYKIAEETGISIGSLRHRISNMGIDVKYTYVSPAELRSYIRLYKKGYSHQKIADRFGRARSTVCEHLHKAGCYRRKK